MKNKKFVLFTAVLGMFLTFIFNKKLFDSNYCQGEQHTESRIQNLESLITNKTRLNCYIILRPDLGILNENTNFITLLA